MRLKQLILFSLTLFLLFAVPPALASATLQDPPITYLRYDVEIALQPDGNFIVREIQQVRFDGVYHTAFAEIPLNYTNRINNIYVWVDDERYRQAGSVTGVGTYTFNDDGANLYIDWEYPETKPGDVRTFILQYEVHGGLWVYPEETVLEWRAVPADRSGFPVLDSHVTVIFPTEVPAGELRYTAYGPAFTAKAKGSQISFTATKAIADGTHFQVRVGFPPSLVAAEPQPWQVAEDTANLVYRLESIDVDLSIGADGRVKVSEQQRVAVDAGAMYEGQRGLALAYLDGVTNINIFEGEQRFSLDQGNCESYCFRVNETAGSPQWVRYDQKQRRVIINENQAGQLNLTWTFPALVKGEATTFRLEYEALGAIQLLPDSQRLNWTVVFAEHDAPVESASLGVELPPGVTWEQVRLQGGKVQLQPDGSRRLVPDRPILPGQVWRVNLTLPVNATQAAKPAWQQALEAAEAEARQAEIWLARQQIGAGVAGALLLVGGLLAVFLAWRRWGQDRPAITAVDYLTQPPSDLPPGIVAYLVDEQPTAKGVLASLFHLATLGLLRLHLNDRWLRLQRNWPDELGEGQVIQTITGETVTVPGHLVTLFNALRTHIPVDESVALSSIGQHFQAALPSVYVDMANEASRFFTGLPAVVRHRWLSWGQWLVLAGVGLAGVAWFFYVPELGQVALAPPLAAILVGGVLTLVSRWMPQRTAVGVEEAARWRAFQRYLQNLQAYGNLAEAQQILDRYFAYAVALDVDEAVLAQAESLGAAMPIWTNPVRLEPAPELTQPAPTPPARQNEQSGWRLSRPPAGPPLRVVRPEPAPGRPKPGGAKPVSLPELSLQGLSSQLGQTLAEASQHVGDLLNTAVGNTQEDTPFKLIQKGIDATAQTTWNATSSTFEVLGEILEEAASSGGGSGGYSGSSSSSWSSRSSSRSSSWSSSSSSRSSSSRRSGGGGRRGFG